MRFNTLATIITALLVTSMALPVSAGEKTLPDPDGKPADLSKPVQVYILLGQSNMLGFGKIKGGDGSVSYTHLTLPTNREV